MNRPLRLLELFLGISAWMILHSSGSAAFQVRLTSYANNLNASEQLIITDQDQADRQSAAGAIDFSGNILGFSVDVRATSSQFDGRSQQNMTLAISGISRRDGGMLLIEVTDTGWATAHSALHASAKGAVPKNSQVLFGAYLNGNDREFGDFEVDPAILLKANGSSNFALSDAMPFPDFNGTYSMTMSAMMLQADGGNDPFQFQMMTFANPEPWTLMSAMTGAPLIVGFLRRQRNFI